MWESFIKFGHDHRVANSTPTNLNGITIACMQDLEPFDKIIYMFAFDLDDSSEFTPFQAFPRKLVDVMDIGRTLCALPSDIHEPNLESSELIARRRAGLGGWSWFLMNRDIVVSSGGPSPFAPLCVIFTVEKHLSRFIAHWAHSQIIQPLHVTPVRVNHAVHPADLSLRRLQKHCKTAIHQAKRLEPLLKIDTFLEALNDWNLSTSLRPSSLRLHSHNITMPNESKRTRIAIFI